MSKITHNDVFDTALQYIEDNADRLFACSEPPTTYAEASATFALADQVIDGTDFTGPADGDVSGRKTTIAAQNAVPIDATGMMTHLAVCDSVATKVLHVTEANSVRSNTAQAGGASTITLDAAASAVDDTYNNMYVTITGGTGVGQSRKITDYVGATKVATVGSAWTTQPDNTSTFRVFGQQLTSGGTVNLPAFDVEYADPTP